MADKIVPHFHNEPGFRSSRSARANSCASARCRRSITRMSFSIWATIPRSSVPIARRCSGSIPRSILQRPASRVRAEGSGRRPTSWPPPHHHNCRRRHRRPDGCAYAGAQGFSGRRARAELPSWRKPAPASSSRPMRPASCSRSVSAMRWRPASSRRRKSASARREPVTTSCACGSANLPKIATARPIGWRIAATCRRRSPTQPGRTPTSTSSSTRGGGFRRSRPWHHGAPAPPAGKHSRSAASGWSAPTGCGRPPARASATTSRPALPAAPPGARLCRRHRSGRISMCRRQPLAGMESAPRALSSQSRNAGQHRRHRQRHLVEAGMERSGFAGRTSRALFSALLGGTRANIAGHARAMGEMGAA